MSLFGLTDSYGFGLIDFSSQTWHNEEYANWRKLDSLLSGEADLAVPYVRATGAVNAYVLTFDPVITAYTSGLIISFSSNLANTNAATINVNGLGAKALIRDGTALVGAEIAADDYVRAVYDGTRFSIIQPTNRTATVTDGSITTAKLSTGHPTWDASSNFSAAGTVTSGGAVTGTDFKTDTSKYLFRHAGAYTSAVVTYATTDPSGGNDGDLWFKYTP